MTNTPDELERLARAATPGKWTNGTDPCHFDAPEVTDGKTFSYWVSDEHNAAFIAAANPETILAILSERAELLATVERMREELDVAAVHLQIAGGWLREAGDDGQRANELLRASNRARAALTTGEAGSSISQNDQPGLAFSDAGEP